MSQARQQAAERPGWSWPIHGWLRGARRSGGRVCALSDVLAWPPRVSRLSAGDVSFAARGRLSRKRWATSACGRRRRCLPRAPVACSEARRFHPLPLPPSKRVALGETLAFFRGRSGWPILQGGAFIGPCWRQAGPRLAVSSETVGAGAARGRLSRKRWAATRGVGGRGEPRAPVACSDPRRLLPPSFVEAGCARGNSGVFPRTGRLPSLSLSSRAAPFLGRAG